MNILAIGDIVGEVGTEMFLSSFDALKRQYQIDFCIVNGENAEPHNGISRRTAEKLLECGADVITLGNHAFRCREAESLLVNNKRVLRPANFPPGAPGSGLCVMDADGKKIGVINLMGKVDMGLVDCPFRKVDELLKNLQTDFVFVDFHAEKTSEKVSMGWYLDGRVTGIFGTHTHVQTADNWVMPKGTGYLSDLGMTGPQYSCLGVKREIIIDWFKSGMPKRFETADGKAQLCGAVFFVDDETKKTEKVERIWIR